MKTNAYIYQVPEIAPLLKEADHVDVKIVEAALPMREFIAGMINYQPAWITFLYGVRWFFVRLLGMKQSGIPKSPHYTADTLPMLPGKKAAFFTLRMAQDERYWFAEISESHLTAKLGVVVEPLDGDKKRFHVVTVVHYNSWAGPVYFNVIRPFHHVVVRQMAKAGVSG